MTCKDNIKPVASWADGCSATPGPFPRRLKAILHEKTSVILQLTIEISAQ